MSVEFEVQEAIKKKDLPATAQRGPLVVWELVLKSTDGEIVKCERNKKPQNLIKVGSKLYGYIEEREGFPPVLKETERAKDEDGNPIVPEVQSDDRYDRKPDHPINVARARHAAAMSSTPEYYRLMVDFGVLTPPDPKSENPKTQMLDQLQNMMLWLESTYPPDPRDDTTDDYKT